MRPTWHPHGPLGAVENTYYSRWRDGVPIPYGNVPNPAYTSRWRDGVPIPYGNVPNPAYTSRWRDGVPIPFGQAGLPQLGGVAAAGMAVLGVAYGWQVWQATRRRRAPRPEWLMYTGAGLGMAASGLALFSLAAGGAAAAVSG